MSVTCRPNEGCFDVFVLGDYDFVYTIFQSLASLSNDGTLALVGAMGLLLGLFTIAVRSILVDGATKFPLYQLVVAYVLWVMLMGNRADVVIDELNPTLSATSYVRVDKIENVPWGAAAMGWFISTLGYELTDMMETAFSIPGVPRMSEGGFMAVPNTLSRLRLLDMPHVPKAPKEFYAFRKTLGNYIADCTMVGISTGNLPSDTLFSSTDPVAALKYDSRWSTTISYLSGADENTGDTRTCQDVHAEIDVARSDLVNWVSVPMATMMGLAVPEGTTASDAAIARMERDFGMLVTNGSEYAQDYIEAAMINALWDRALTGSPMTQGDSQFTVMAQTAFEQRSTEWVAEEALWRRFMNGAVGFFEGFTYALVPFMSFLIGLGAVGLKLVGSYVKLGLWVMLWSPVLAVVNLFQTLNIMRIGEALKGTLSSQAELGSMIAVQRLQEESMSALATGSLMATMTPMLTMFILFGGVYAATAVAGRLQGNDHTNEKTATPDAVNVGAAMGQATSLTSDRISGLRQTGADQQFHSFTGSQLASRALQDQRAISESSTEQYASDVSRAFSSSSSSTQQRSTVASQMVASMHQSSIAELASSARSTALSDGHAISNKISDDALVKALMDSKLSVGLVGVGGRAERGISFGEESSESLGSNLTAALGKNTALQSALNKAITQSGTDSQVDGWMKSLGVSDTEALRESRSDALSQLNQLSATESLSGTSQWSQSRTFAQIVDSMDGGDRDRLVEAGHTFSSTLSTGSNLMESALSEVQRLGYRGDTEAAAALLVVTGAGSSGSEQVSFDNASDAQRSLLRQRDDIARSLLPTGHATPGFQSSEGETIATSTARAANELPAGVVRDQVDDQAMGVDPRAKSVEGEVSQQAVRSPMTADLSGQHSDSLDEQDAFVSNESNRIQSQESARLREAEHQLSLIPGFSEVLSGSKRTGQIVHAAEKYGLDPRDALGIAALNSAVSYYSDDSLPGVPAHVREEATSQQAQFVDAAKNYLRAEGYSEHNINSLESAMRSPDDPDLQTEARYAVDRHQLEQSTDRTRTHLGLTP